MNERPEDAIDLGGGFWAAWVGWAPDRVLNPQYKDIPDEPHYGLRVGHPRADRPDETHEAFLTIRGPVQEKLAEMDVARELSTSGVVERGRPMWDLISEDPLTLAPSIHCVLVGVGDPDVGCGAHGFIREGRWVS